MRSVLPQSLQRGKANVLPASELQLCANLAPASGEERLELLDHRRGCLLG